MRRLQINLVAAAPQSGSQILISLSSLDASQTKKGAGFPYPAIFTEVAAPDS
jgi:hypothetical protein